MGAAAHQVEVPDRSRLLTVDEFESLGDSDVLLDDRLELLEGLIDTLAPLHLEHARAADAIARQLETLVAPLELSVDRAV